MNWTRNDLNSPNPAFHLSASFRLLEGDRGGPPVPSVRSISVKKIVVVKNERLWGRYQLARRGLAERTPEIERKLRKVGSTLATGLSQAGTQFDGFPIIDPTIGETLLFHGTDAKAFIVGTNIDPIRGRNKAAPGAKPNYGLLGQGAYFSDQIAKSATYTLCRLCKGFRRGHVDPERREPQAERGDRRLGAADPQRAGVVAIGRARGRHRELPHGGGGIGDAPGEDPAIRARRFALEIGAQGAGIAARLGRRRARGGDDRERDQERRTGHRRILHPSHPAVGLTSRRAPRARRAGTRSRCRRGTAG